MEIIIKFLFKKLGIMTYINFDSKKKTLNSVTETWHIPMSYR